MNTEDMSEELRDLVERLNKCIGDADKDGTRDHKTLRNAVDEIVRVHSENITLNYRLSHAKADIEYRDRQLECANQIITVFNEKFPIIDKVLDLIALEFGDDRGGVIFNELSRRYAVREKA